MLPLSRKAGPTVDKPNVLFIMTDQMRATASHLYGNAVWSIATEDPRPVPLPPEPTP